MLLIGLLFLFSLVSSANARYFMYLTGQHNVFPEPNQIAEVTHVGLAFMQSSIFNEKKRTSWPLFTTVEEVREKFTKGTKIMVAIGGWGDTTGFSVAAKTEKSRKLFAKNIKAMVDATGAAGVDIDWEYPGGNGEDYKQVPNSEKEWEIEAYPLLLSTIRSALGKGKLMSAAVPGRWQDMIAFTEETIPKISKSLDFCNIMTYDLVNRRDTEATHHSGIEASTYVIDRYLKWGVHPLKANLGFGFYVKWFTLDPNGTIPCERKKYGVHVGCSMVVSEDPETGADLGKTGQFSWHDEAPKDLAVSFGKAVQKGKFDTVHGGQYYWDEEENLWWTWDSVETMAHKFPIIVTPKRLGGVFAWGLGEDAPKFEHLDALTREVELNSLGWTTFRDEL